MSHEGLGAWNCLPSLSFLLSPNFSSIVPKLVNRDAQRENAGMPVRRATSGLSILDNRKRASHSSFHRIYDMALSVMIPSDIESLEDGLFRVWQRAPRITYIRNGKHRVLFQERVGCFRAPLLDLLGRRLWRLKLC